MSLPQLPPPSHDMFMRDASSTPSSSRLALGAMEPSASAGTLVPAAGPVRRGRTPTPRPSPLPLSSFPSSSSSQLPVSRMVDLHVRYGKLECELQVASQEAAAALASRERFRLMGSEQYACAKAAMYQVAEVYLEEGQAQAQEMMQQEQQLVSRYGSVLVSEAHAYQQAQIQGNEALQQLHQEAALVQWIKNRAEEAFAREHVVCQTLRIEAAQQSTAMSHHEQHIQELENRCLRYRTQRDEARRASDAAEVTARMAEERALHRHEAYNSLSAAHAQLQNRLAHAGFEITAARDSAAERASYAEMSAQVRDAQDAESHAMWNLD